MKLRIVLTLLISASVVTCLAEPQQYAATVDATGQRANAPRGRGPFPGSAFAGHSPDFFVELAVQFPKPELRADGRTLVDFVLTNIGTTTIYLPISLKAPTTNGQISVMSLWLTSDGLVEHYVIDNITQQPFKIAAVGTSADLFGDPTNPADFTVLKPGERLLVHASSRVQLTPGVHAVTSHAELVLVDGPPVVRSNLIGWADSETITERFEASVDPAHLQIPRE